MPATTVATSGHAVRALRLGVGISLRRLASEAQISPGHLSRIERGERDVPLSTFIRLTAVLADIATAARNGDAA